jgi:alpha-ketoglutarate-dependent taurine dioxygenase
LVPDSHHTLKAVNYSPPFQGNLPLERLRRNDHDGTVASDDTERLLELHEALGEFAKLCDDKEGRWRYTHQLEPGECVIFDNRRVLHARTAFEFTDGEGVEGEEKGRWLKGAYMDGDEVWSRWRVEQEKAGKAPKKGRTLFV